MKSQLQTGFKQRLKRLAVDISDCQSDLRGVSHNFDVLESECARVEDFCAHTKDIVAHAVKRYEGMTALDGLDYKFLAVVTALQTLRWVLIDCFSKFGEGASRDDRLDHDASTIKTDQNDALESGRESLSEISKNDPLNRWRQQVFGKAWSSILSDPVPFDTVTGGKAFGLGMSGNNHREMTLGHDPLLGWFFGVVNIMTDTTTIKDLRTFKMSRVPPPLRFSSPVSFGQAWNAARLSCKEDYKRLCAAVFMEAVHLKSDFFTKCGLPIPLLSAFAPELSTSLYEEHYDSLCLCKDIGIVAQQAALAAFVNTTISFLHGLYFDPSKWPNRKVYEVKTRKILMLSNVFSSSSNVLYVAVRASMGDVSSWKHFDFGGILVTLWRVITDSSFMREIREECIGDEFRRKLKGKPLNLWRR